tara:strand:+ start:721 stop:999 length:279 start_codon:yes stop_codon:yes gene_type:complete
MRLTSKRISKQDIDEVKDWSEDHALYCSKIWGVDFNFEKYDSEVQTFYIRDLQIKGREELQFRHLFELEEKIQAKFGKRYRVGIIYENAPLE